MVALTFPDGTIRHYHSPINGGDVAAEIGSGLAKAALVIRVDGKFQDLKCTIEHDAEIEIITLKDKSEEVLELLRHDAAHILAEAVKELYPDVQVTIGPAILDGFYYDFSRTAPFTQEDLQAIEDRMH